MFYQYAHPSFDPTPLPGFVPPRIPTPPAMRAPQVSLPQKCTPPPPPSLHPPTLALAPWLVLHPDPRRVLVKIWASAKIQ